MELLLLRHADAEPRAASDSARPLTEKGLHQAKRAGRFLSDRAICPDLILTSPYLRAAQTAEIVGKALKREVTEAAFLASGMNPATAISELRGYNRFATVMIVGHEPDFSLLAATLLGLPNADALQIHKATLLSLEVHALRPGGASLELLIHSRTMDSLD